MLSNYCHCLTYVTTWYGQKQNMQTMGMCQQSQNSYEAHVISTLFVRYSIIPFSSIPKIYFLVVPFEKYTYFSSFWETYFFYCLFLKDNTIQFTSCRQKVAKQVSNPNQLHYPTLLLYNIMSRLSNLCNRPLPQLNEIDLVTQWNRSSKLTFVNKTISKKALE